MSRVLYVRVFVLLYVCMSLRKAISWTPEDLCSSDSHVYCKAELDEKKSPGRDTEQHMEVLHTLIQILKILVLLFST